MGQNGMEPLEKDKNKNKINKGGTQVHKVMYFFSLLHLHKGMTGITEPSELFSDGWMNDNTIWMILVDEQTYIWIYRWTNEWMIPPSPPSRTLFRVTRKRIRTTRELRKGDGSLRGDKFHP